MVRYAGTPRYDEYPCLTPDAALAGGARGEAAGLRLSLARPSRSAGGRQGSTGPCITGREALAGSRAEFMFLALNIAGSDGAPARVLAGEMP